MKWSHTGGVISVRKMIHGWNVSTTSLFLVEVLLMIVSYGTVSGQSVASTSISTHQPLASASPLASSSSTQVPSSSSAAAQSSSSSTIPSTSTIPPTTTPDPTVCPDSIADKCKNELFDLYAKNGSHIGTDEQINQLKRGLHCEPNITAVNTSCATIIPLDACALLVTSSLNHYLVSGGHNFTKFSLMCSAQGHLVPIAWEPALCPTDVKKSIVKTTAAVCMLAGIITDASNNTGALPDLYCYDADETTQNDEDLSVDPTSMLQHWTPVHGCTTLKPKSTDIPLSPNPVSPAAITAIVVLVCLAIVAVLAAFFFWPKCHISDPALLPKKQKGKENAGMINEGFDFGGAAAGGAQYNARRDQVAMKIPPTFGPSAA